MILNIVGYSQELPEKEVLPSSMRDSLQKMGFYIMPDQKREDIEFTVEDAVNYLTGVIRHGYWKDKSVPLRTAIDQLVFYVTNKPYDSLKVFLLNYPFDSLNIPPEKFFVFDTLHVKVPHVYYRVMPSDTDKVPVVDSLARKYPPDSTRTDFEKIKPDTVLGKTPELILIDSCLLMVSDTLEKVGAYSESHPFSFFNSPYIGDSLAMAVKKLIGYLDDRDSSIIVFKGISGMELPVWLNSRTGDMKRYWLKNEYDDSVTVWIGSIGRNTIGMFLEDGITFKRLSKHSDFYDAQLDIKQVNTRKLQEVNKIYIKPRYWKYRSEAVFVFNQALLTNWVKGGENSISTAMDITGYADYNNKELKLTSNNFARLKYGLIKSGDNPLRKNLDLLETNSKLNHKAFGKFDFSAIMLFKTQISKGYNYPNDSVPVSRFLNPAVLTIGVGLDYKPNKTTSINIAPLSYKATFVPDTASIDQTKYGVSKDRRSMHEPGASIQITNEIKPLKTVTIKNRIQFFTNYIHNPFNIDVDWEMISEVKLNWFTDLRLNTHLIFDDDTRTIVKNKDGSSVLGEDGKPKKTARIQFKELLGVSFVFRF